MLVVFILLASLMAVVDGIEKVTSGTTLPFILIVSAYITFFSTWQLLAFRKREMQLLVGMVVAMFVAPIIPILWEMIDVYRNPGSYGGMIVSPAMILSPIVFVLCVIGVATSGWESRRFVQKQGNSAGA